MLCKKKEDIQDLTAIAQVSTHCLVLKLKHCEICDVLKVSICLKFHPTILQFSFIIIFKSSI